MKRLRWLTYVPVLLWMVIIFWFSGNNSEESTAQSGQVSFGIVDVVERIFHLNIPDEKKAEISSGVEKVVRKLAHLCEYMVLAALVWTALYCTWKRGGKRAGYIAAVLVTALYAASDEIHQYFVPGRHGTALDVLLDTVGAAAACLLIMAVRHGFEKRKDRRKSRGSA